MGFWKGFKSGVRDTIDDIKIAPEDLGLLMGYIAVPLFIASVAVVMIVLVVVWAAGG